jgi:hypothetical protein
MDSEHDDAAINTTAVTDLGSTSAKVGLGRQDDMQEIFQQVKQLDDIIFAGQVPSTAQLKANRHNIKVQVQGRCTYYIANNMINVGIYVQIYEWVPRRDIAGSGIGSAGDNTPGGVIRNNYNSRSLVDYNDAASLGIAAGNISDAYSTVKPVVAATDHWTTPFMVPEFTRNFKITKVHKVFLPPSGQYVFTIKLPLRTVERNWYEKNPTGAPTTYLKAFAKGAFIRFHGAPVNDTATPTLVNFAPASLNIVSDKKYEFSYGHQPTYFTVRGSDSLGTVVNTKQPGLTDQTVAEDYLS